MTRRYAILAALVLVAALAASAALAAGSGGEGAAKGSEFILISQIVLLILVGQTFGEALARIGQPAVMGQLLAGIVLGPSVLGALLPDVQHAIFPPNPEQKAMLDGVAQFGILMLLLLAGMETDLALVRRVRRAAVTVSLTGIVLPFAAGFTLGQFLPQELLPHPEMRLVASLFLGTALSISSVKIVAVVVREMGFIRRNIGQVILASAIIDDTVGWIIIAVIFGLAQRSTIDLMSVAQGVGGTVAFLVASFTVGLPLVIRTIRWTNDTFKTEAAVIAVILVIMGSMAAITHLIGVHTVLGAFIAGILVGESPILTRQIDEQLRSITAALFMPVFFGSAGLTSDLTVLGKPELALLTLGLIAIATIGKASGAFAGGWFGGLKVREAVALACGMNARGSTEVIVATIGLSLGMLSQNLYTMILAMAVITTLAMPPMLRWSLARIPINKEEQKRLEREDFEQRGFVSNLERILVAADDSPSGRLASRLAGLLAGSRGMPVTVLKLSATSGEGEPAVAKPDAPKEPKEETAETAEAKGESKKAAAEPEKDSAKSAPTKADKPKASPKKKKAMAARAKKDEVKTQEPGAPAKEPEAEKAEPKQDKPEPAAVAAEKSKPATPEKTDKESHIEVVEPAADETPEAAVAREAEKGFDMLFIGREPMKEPDDGFTKEVSRIANSFESAIAPVLARGRHAENERINRFNILVPVSGNAFSRRGAEVAIALAKAANAPVTALSVTTTSKSATPQQRRTARREAREVINEIVGLGEHYDVRVRTAMRHDISSEEAIVQQLKRGRHDLIVMGVSRRPGEVLYFGNVPAAILERAECSILFISS